MGYFYVLQSLKDFGYYFGSTEDLHNRVQRHNAGYVKSTKGRRPWKLVYNEVYETIEEARFREYTVKRNANERYKIIKKLEK